MTYTRLYDVIKGMLTIDVDLRYNDKELAWAIWTRQGITEGGRISKYDFSEKAESFETIRRTRQKVQENYPNLGRVGESKKERSRGTFVYREKIPVFDDSEGTVKFV